MCCSHFADFHSVLQRLQSKIDDENRTNSEIESYLRSHTEVCKILFWMNPYLRNTASSILKSLYNDINSTVFLVVKDAWIINCSCQAASISRICSLSLKVIPLVTEKISRNVDNYKLLI